jgi:hypothetical protein
MIKTIFIVSICIVGYILPIIYLKYNYKKALDGLSIEVGIVDLFISFIPLINIFLCIATLCIIIDNSDKTFNIAQKFFK